MRGPRRREGWSWTGMRMAAAAPGIRTVRLGDGWVPGREKTTWPRPDPTPVRPHAAIGRDAESRRRPRDGHQLPVQLRLTSHPGHPPDLAERARQPAVLPGRRHPPLRVKGHVAARCAAEGDGPVALDRRDERREGNLPDWNRPSTRSSDWVIDSVVGSVCPTRPPQTSRRTLRSRSPSGRRKGIQAEVSTRAPTSSTQ